MQKTRLEAVNRRDPVLRVPLGQPHPQRPDGLGEEALADNLARRPLEQLQALNVADRRAVLDQLLHVGDHCGALSRGAELRLCRELQDLQK